MRAPPLVERIRVRVSRAIVAAVALVLAGCEPAPRHVAPGDAANGRLLLRQFGCGSCHRIPGVPDARGSVGPPLAAVARRVYIGGFVPNTPENMSRWIRRPSAIDPGTAMPDLQVDEVHARDMTAYLYTLR
jgi:cytochrome c2